jgi:flagellar hook-associated protein 1 FlgK
MGTISSAFHLISGALEADQSALSIVANNVANANTPGYTEETPTWRENDPVSINGVYYGTGVSETGPTSVRDRVLLERLNQQQQLAASSTTRLAALNTMQTLFTPDSGSTSSKAGDIGSDLTSFFSSFSSLEANSGNNALRQQVLSTGTTLAGDISNAAGSLNAQRASLDQEAAAVITQVNALTGAVAQLNAQIQSTSPNEDAGVLEDQRQQDLSKLSQLIGINQITTENNGLSITTTAGQTLVAEGSNELLSAGMVDGVTHFFIGTTDITTQLASGGGSLGGYLTARDQDIPQGTTYLDELAYGIATAVNQQNNAGTDLNGVAGAGVNPANAALNIFNQPAAAAGSAAGMSVVMTDPNQIAAAGPAAGTGDNSNAVAMAGLAGAAIVKGRSPTDFFSNFVTMLGATAAEVQTENTAQNASVTQLQNQNNALSAVNLNNEAASMQQLERSYQAASQVFTILNTIMGSALNLGVETAVT